MEPADLEKQNKKNVLIRSTIPFKLKDKKNRNWKAFNLKAQFTFLPESIIISKLHGMNNTFVLSAVLTKEEIEKVRKLEESTKIKPAQK